MRLIVGLGNPGRAYANNHHNIGFICLNQFAKTQSIPLDKKQGLARIGIGKIASSEVILARPQTYMNSSGQSVCLLVRKFSINPNNLFVIHDDLDLPLGKIRIRQGSGSGGHKGVESIIAHLDSKDFIRVRVGIGRPSTIGDSAEINEADTIDYVLSDFTSQEKQVITTVISRVSEAILYLFIEGLVAAMNKYN